MVCKWKIGGWEDPEFRECQSVLSPHHGALVKYYQPEPELRPGYRPQPSRMGMCTNRPWRTPNAPARSHSEDACEWKGVWCACRAGQALADSEDDRMLKDAFGGMRYWQPDPSSAHKLAKHVCRCALLAWCGGQGPSASGVLCALGLPENWRAGPITVFSWRSRQDDVVWFFPLSGVRNSAVVCLYYKKNILWEHLGHFSCLQMRGLLGCFPKVLSF